MRAIRLTAALGAVVVVLSGCSSDSSTQVVDDAVDAVRSAPAATAAAGPARFLVQLDLAGEELEAQGVVDDALDLAEIEMRGPDSDELHVIVIGQTLYRRLSVAEMSQLGVTTPWGFVDRAKAGASSQGLPGFSMTSGGDLMDVVAALADVGRDGVRRVRRDDVRGVETTRYDVDMDLGTLLKASGGERDTEAFEEELGEIVVEFDVWLDDDGAVRKFVMEMDFGIGPSMAMTAELFDFGKAVAPAPPAPGDVTDLTGRLDELEQPTD